MQRWGELEGFLRGSASRDLEATGEVRPCLVAFRGDAALLVAYLRPFPGGGYADPLIELLALACPLGADRLAVSFGGRAWSLDDPVPPVVPEGDFRQRVLTMQGTDGSAGEPCPFGVLWPFEQGDRGVSWGAAIRNGDADGWVPHALTAAVGGRARLAASTEEITRQVDRCARLGHELHLAPAAQQQLTPVR